MENKTLTFVAIGLAVAVVLVLILGFVLGWFQRGKLKLVDGDGQVDRTSTGAIDESRYISIARSIKQSLEGVTYQAAYFGSAADQALALNYNELRLLSNIYARDFKTEEAPTLRAIIQNEWLGGSIVSTPCTAAEKTVINSNCYKQQKLIEKLNYINA